MSIKAALLATGSCGFYQDKTCLGLWVFNPGENLLMEKLLPALIGTIGSALVAFALLYINRRKELRQASIELYKELYSPEGSKSRSSLEKMVLDRPHIDWNKIDPYDLDEVKKHRKGYASLTRFYSRLSILYREKELDRKFAEKLLYYVSGYLWGLIYERAVCRENMYTRDDILYIFRALESGSKRDAFASGYESAIARRRAVGG